MKKITLTLVLAIFGLVSYSQFDRLVVEEVANGGIVPGKTYRVYAVLQNVGDQLHAVYGIEGHKMEISSTKPFYQHPQGGGTSKEINKATAEDVDQLKFDSWVTIGLENHYVNSVNTFIIDLTSFEEGNALVTSDGAWFVTADNFQGHATEDKKILLMQLTTEGKVDGIINLQGRHFPDGLAVTWKKEDIKFSCGN